MPGPVRRLLLSVNKDAAEASKCQTFDIWTLMSGLLIGHEVRKYRQVIRGKRRSNLEIVDAQFRGVQHIIDALRWIIGDKCRTFLLVIRISKACCGKQLLYGLAVARLV